MLRSGRNRPVQGAVLTVGFALITATLAVAYLPPNARSEPGGTYYEDAAESWDFTGFNGSLSFESNETTFLDFAFPITEDTDAETVNITVTFTWPGERYGDQEQPWICLYWGLRTGEYLVYEPPMTTGCGYHLKDGQQEVSFEVLGTKVVDHSEVHAVCVLFQCFPEEDSYTVSSARAFAAKAPQEFFHWEDRPVGHLMYRFGGVDNVTTTVEATWEDTIVAVSRLGSESTIEYYVEDFESLVGARADTFWKSPELRGGAVLETRLGDTGTPFYFFYDVIFSCPGGISCHLQDHAGYERPDGSVLNVGYGTEEISSQAGTWRFWSNESLSDHADRPVLLGGHVKWAELPWETAESVQASSTDE